MNDSNQIYFERTVTYDLMAADLITCVMIYAKIEVCSTIVDENIVKFCSSHITKENNG